MLLQAGWRHPLILTVLRDDVGDRARPTRAAAGTGNGVDRLPGTLVSADYFQVFGEFDQARAKFFAAEVLDREEHNRSR